MPGLDRTGPEGKGSQTGRKLGKCNPANRTAADEAATEETRLGLGKRMGRGLGRGRGFGRGRGGAQDKPGS